MSSEKGEGKGKGFSAVFAAVAVRDGAEAVENDRKLREASKSNESSNHEETGDLLMHVEYTGRPTPITTKLKTQAEAGLERIARVTNRCTSAHIILTEDKHRRIVEVTVQCRGEAIVATAEANEMESALRKALEKVEQQAIRHKERWATVRSHAVKPLAA